MSERFEESIRDFFIKFSDFEYLDLAFPSCELLKQGNLEFYCFNKGHRHEYHTENKQLNLIADYSLTGLSHHKYLRYQLNLLSKVTCSQHHKITSRLDNIEAKLATLNRSQQNLTLAELNTIVEDLSSKIKRVEAIVTKLETWSNT